jgi:hypothetical protein
VFCPTWRAVEAEVDLPGMQRFERPEPLGDRERRMVVA